MALRGVNTSQIWAAIAALQAGLLSLNADHLSSGHIPDARFPVELDLSVFSAHWSFQELNSEVLTVSQASIGTLQGGFFWKENADDTHGIALTARNGGLVISLDKTLSLNGTGLLLAPLDDAPENPSPGQIYFSSNTHFYGWNGTTWKQLDN